MLLPENAVNFQADDAGQGGAMKSLVPEGAIIPDHPIPAETGAEPLTQAQIDAINKAAVERGKLIESLG